MNKFNRSYSLGVTNTDQVTVTYIQPPFTVEFEVYRNSFSSANIASFRIYNLAPATRSQILKDQYDFGRIRPIAFKAGYNNQLGLAFGGYVTQCWSAREGSNMITTIECFDGGYAFQTSITSMALPSGTPIAPTPGVNAPSIIGNLVASMPGVTLGAVGNYPGTTTRGTSLSGSTVDLLNQYTGNGFFIDNNIANCLNDSEALAGNPPIINAASGLLGSPVKEETLISFSMLFEPTLQIGQLITLNSLTAGNFNGTHKVISLRHRGTISASVCGDATTEVGLLPGTFTQVSSTSVAAGVTGGL